MNCFCAFLSSMWLLLSILEGNQSCNCNFSHSGFLPAFNISAKKRWVELLWRVFGGNIKNEITWQLTLCRPQPFSSAQASTCRVTLLYGSLWRLKFEGFLSTLRRMLNITHSRFETAVSNKLKVG